MSKAIRATIELSGITVEVFKLPDGNYVMSQSQIALAVEVHRFSLSRYLDEKCLEASDSNSYRCHIFNFDNGKKSQRGGNGQIKAFTIQIASQFWAEQAFKGNKLAQSLTYACMVEALKRRCDNAFDIPKTTEQYEQESYNDRNTWLESRSFLKDAHASFTNCCLYNGFNAAVAHDEITKQLLGKTARELREDEVVNGNYRVGLNHIAYANDLVEIAKIKLAFSRYRTGTVKQRVKRAIEEVTNG